MAHSYRHPDAPALQKWLAELGGPEQPALTLCARALDWFDANEIAYSRLNAPFTPLQRSDLDVLRWHSGTCGDFSNLLVSLLQAAGLPAAYAVVTRDCYGDLQDHICAATQDAGGRWVLVDATDPYRKWHGLACPHQDYTLLTPAAMTARFQQEEKTWQSAATEWSDPRTAGLLYAPWLHSEIVMETADSLGSVFILLTLPAPGQWRLTAYYQCYTAVRGVALVRRVHTAAASFLQFSANSAAHIWDEGQWSAPGTVRDLPAKVVFASEQIDAVLAAHEKELASVITCASR